MDEIVGRSRGSGECARLRAGTLIEKNRQFLTKAAGIVYCFSEMPTTLSAACTWATRPGFGVEDGSDSGMAPQAIETTQNGLGDPSARGCRRGESIRRIRYDAKRAVTSVLLRQLSHADEGGWIAALARLGERLPKGRRFRDGGSPASSRRHPRPLLTSLTDSRPLITPVR
jgi:hypothetical protein